jgi:hypothetical protein
MHSVGLLFTYISPLTIKNTECYTRIVTCNNANCMYQCLETKCIPINLHSIHMLHTKAALKQMAVQTHTFPVINHPITINTSFLKNV